jgi:hypothetical protein
MKTKVVVTKPMGCPKAIWECFLSQLPATEEWTFEDADGTLRPQVVSVGLRPEGNLSEDSSGAAHSGEHDQMGNTVREAFQRALQQHGLRIPPESWTHYP